MAGREFEAGLVADLGLHSLLAVEVDGAAVLLTRDDDGIHAVSGTCPHAGAPLAEGVRHGGRIVCPWHKAAFCLRTGALLEPPAVDALDRFDVRVEAGKIMLSRRDEEKSHDDAANDKRCFVIVGAGAAGAMAAQVLREEGFAGRVVLLDRENRVPYDRTVLSKYALSGEKGAEKTPLQSQAFYKQQRIERITAEVTGLDVRDRFVSCADGSRYRYDALLLATGGSPAKPDLQGEQGDVFVLRSRADAEAILARAERSERVVVLGAGFIGMEVAASLRERGLDVTVVAREAAPFEKQLGREVGDALKALHESKGVCFRLGRTVSRLEGEGSKRSVVLDDGSEIKADFVVAGYGVAPATQSLDGLMLEEDGSVRVDARMCAGENVYAAGDIARFPDRGNGTAIRVEHWRVAEQQGRVAALNMLGRNTRFTATPVFWTIQYMKRVDYIGHAQDWDDVVIHGDLETPEFLAYYIKDGVVAAAAGMGRDKDTAALGELFDLRRDWTAAALGDQPAALLASLDHNSKRAS